MDWDIFMAETKTKAHVSLMSKGFKHAPISFAIIGEVFHDLEFLSLNEFLKWCKSYMIELWKATEH